MDEIYMPISSVDMALENARVSLAYDLQTSGLSGAVIEDCLQKFETTALRDGLQVAKRQADALLDLLDRCVKH